MYLFCWLAGLLACWLAGLLACWLDWRLHHTEVAPKLQNAKLGWGWTRNAVCAARKGKLDRDGQPRRRTNSHEKHKVRHNNNDRKVVSSSARPCWRPTPSSTSATVLQRRCRDPANDNNQFNFFETRYMGHLFFLHLAFTITVSVLSSNRASSHTELAVTQTKQSHRHSSHTDQAVTQTKQSHRPSSHTDQAVTHTKQSQFNSDAIPVEDGSVHMNTIDFALSLTI